MEPWKNRITGSGVEDPEQLLANPRNFRIHPKHQQDALEGVLNEVGWVQNVIVNQRTGHVVDGHLRVSLALSKAEKAVPVVYVDLSEGEEATILATIDPLSALAATDKVKLDDLLRDVQTGEPAIQKMLAELAVDNGLSYGATNEEVDAEPQVDRAAELQEQWKTERGQIWQLGEHRLMCGDSTSGDVSHLMGDEHIDTVVSDPPYGINFDTDYRRFTGGIKVGTNHDQVANDDVPFDPSRYLNFEHVVLWGANFFADKLPRGTWLIWDKRFANGEAFLSDAELAWMKSGSGAYIFSKTSQGFVRPERVQHPTQKPVELMAWCIEKCKAGPIIFDPYVGSGTTLLAAEQLNRRCFAMEIEPKYVAVALQRFVDATGKEVKCLTAEPVAVNTQVG